MNLLQIQDFTFKFSFSQMDSATWIYAILTLLIFIAFLGLLWGKCWNRGWGLASHVGSLILTLLLALLAAYAVFNLRSVARMEGWFRNQQLSLAQTLSDSGSFNRQVFRSTWDQLAPLGGQHGLTPPLEAGNELRLNTPEDALALASTAADEARNTLRTRPPFSLGIPLATMSSTDVAKDAADNIRFDINRYPVVVTPSNDWTATAAKLQTDHALDTAFASIEPGIRDLKQASLWLLVGSVLLALILVPINALSDIQINPRQKAS